MSVSRRGFLQGLGVGRTAHASAFMAARGHEEYVAEAMEPQGGQGGRPMRPNLPPGVEAIRISSNENPLGPGKAAIDAILGKFPEANRYPFNSTPLDADLEILIAKLNAGKRENVVLGVGSQELLRNAARVFMSPTKHLVIPSPTYGDPAGFAQNALHYTLKSAPVSEKTLKTDLSVLLPLVKGAGLVYLCNPNNPTGLIVPKDEVKALLDGIPKTMPVLIDEAYHHFVDDPRYATSVPAVLEGRPVIIARTFSKIAALAGMRLGYAIAPANMIQQMRPYSMGSINALVKWGGVASLKDAAGQAEVKKKVMDLRKKTAADLEAYGYECLPSETNFFMVAIGREIQPVIQEFAAKKVAVGRPFPPMTKHMRVSVGTADEMARFMTAFKEIFPQKTRNTAAGV